MIKIKRSTDNQFYFTATRKGRGIFMSETYTRKASVLKAIKGLLSVFNGTKVTVADTTKSKWVVFDVIVDDKLKPKKKKIV